jgi:hypothetical protein
MRARLVLVVLALGMLAAPSARAGLTAETTYAERGKADFDTFLQVLNPYGTWSKINGLWAYTPRNHHAPYTRGRWLYTEYGWYWQGALPDSWATEHYGYWKRGADKVWSWFPGPFWLPETIEIRRSTEYIGWRSAEVDEEGSFVEAPIDRYTKYDEWSFVTLAHFANPITPALLEPPAVARVQLEVSTECRHQYLTYRAIDRPGPHPADEMIFCADGRMLAPKSMAELAAAATAKPPAPAPVAAKFPNVDPATDKRQVKYWVTMSLPTFGAKPPPDAEPDQLYLYRPDMYQDQDGIERRITLWFNPNARVALRDVLDQPVTPPTNAPAKPGAPAVPVEPPDAAPGSNPFRNPLDAPLHATNAPTGTK